MAFDGIVTHAISNELNKLLTSGRVTKVYQPTATELILTIRAQRSNHSLLLSAHPSYSRIHLTEEPFQNPAEPPMFCMLLRKHLIGSFIESIHQYKNERIIEINVRGKNEIGDDISKKLVVEIMGKHSNIILIDREKGHILDSIKHISPNQNRYRTILPGQTYIYPPDQDKKNPFSTDLQSIEDILENTGGDLSYQQKLVNTFMGISPLLASEICNQVQPKTVAHIAKSFKQMIEQINNDELTPVIHYGGKEDFHVIALERFDGESKVFASVSDMLDNFYADKAERDRVKQQAGDLIKFLNNEYDKNKRKIKKQKQTLKKAERAEFYQKQGELLTAHLHLVKAGDQQIDVIDYYDPDQQSLTIELNPNKTPSENAQHYFKTYQKLKTSKQKLKHEIKKAEQEMDYLDQLIQQVETARVEDIEDIREELREQGYLKKKVYDRKQKKKTGKPDPEQYLATDGTPILVGRNNKQNEYLTMRLAGRRDIWLHTKDIPGSHVVIRSDSPSEDTLAEAAQLAALFSKASQSSSVPVDYTEIRHVKKPNGAKPGYVIYDHQKTLFVTPDQQFIKKLKQ
ncbi:Rqc2 family fibronectin-binding protein [Amphibacillus cookii]|uniref:Rqc2 family fibronectin-binding protein n=1 Tax=Amphibacillus cookii TaxID=767787 RepID=UPI00195EBFA8|nr:NFACT RNA binding domain-containing protein [Amphibacillus cookii]MBM7540517.1 putative ribosome quality control (RQC) complex YloA/Tae2 family protein [Amphibacillus cookii]